MPVRIALAGMSHETNTFAAGRTGLAEFRANGLRYGEEIRELAGTNTVAGGVLGEAAAYPDVTILPIIDTSAIPGGLVTAEAFETVVGEIERVLRAEPVDAVILDLHGAMVTEDADDGDGALMARVRAVVGPDLPVIAVFDLHLNVSHQMAQLADVLIPYDTYPHTDNALRGAEALRLARGAALGEIHPVTALAKIPMMTVGPRQFSGVEPTRSLVARAHEMEGRPGILTVGICFAFPWADCPFAGMGVVVAADGDRALAEATAQELADEIWRRRDEFIPDASTVEEAVHAAMEAEHGPVVLADLGDNPGGGTPADGTALLWALLDLGATGAALAVIADPEVVAQATAAGEGATISVKLGGKTDDLHGYPIPVTATVQSLSDGSFTYEGPMDAGVPNSLGQTAVLRCLGRHGNEVEVIVTERRVQPFDLAVFRSQGIEPTERKILALKSAVHFRGGFMPIAAQVIEVDTPGLTGIDLRRFPYTRLPHPIWPLDEIPG